MCPSAWRCFKSMCVDDTEAESFHLDKVEYNGDPCLFYGRFPANAHPPGLGLSSPQPDTTDHLARVRFLAPARPALWT